MPPDTDEPVSFDKDIKPLFRPRDQGSMRFAFDLTSYDDVKQHASAILGRLRAGNMPCDGPWAKEKVDLFQRWTEGGMPR